MNLPLLFRDAAYGLRLSLRDPLSTLVILISLGIGIGINTAIFSVVDAVLLEPLPYWKPEQLVLIWGSKDDKVRAGVGGQNLESLQAATRSFEGIVPIFLLPTTVLLGTEQDPVPAAQVGVNTFPLLGVKPILGYTFEAVPAELEPDQTAVLSYALWQSRFGGDRAIIGKPLLLDGTLLTIIGVMPREFFFPDMPVRVWTAMSPRAPFYSASHGLARLRDGVSIQVAQTELDNLAPRLKDLGVNVGLRKLGIFRLSTLVLGNIEKALWWLLAAVGLLLLLACVNVTSILLARTLRRQEEVAVRAALGATPRAVFQQFLVEGVVLAGIAGVVGLLLGLLGIHLIRGLNLTEVPRAASIGLNPRVLTYTLAISVLAGLLGSLAPALTACRFNLLYVLQQGVRARSVSRRNMLASVVTLEVALALVLAVGAGLVIRSFVQALRVDWGFDPDKVLLISVRLPSVLHRNTAGQADFGRSVSERVSGLVGVKAVGIGPGIPFRFAYRANPIAVDGRIISRGWSPEPSEGGSANSSEGWSARTWTVGENYFKALGINVLDGRVFSRSDDRLSIKTVVINKAFAERVWPGQSALGKTLEILQLDLNGPDARALVKRRRSDPELRSNLSYYEKVGGAWQVIGIVENVRSLGLELESGAQLYVDYRQWPEPVPVTSLWVVVRTAIDPLTIAGTVKSMIASVNRGVAIDEVVTLQQLVNQSIGGRSANRLLVVVSMTLGGVCTALALIGIFGVVSYSVNEERHKTAVCLALGAQRSGIVKTVLFQNMKPVLLGILLGVLGSLASGRWLESFLYKVDSDDPWTRAGCALLFIVGAVAACLIPAYRAAAANPADTLRTQ